MSLCVPRVVSSSPSLISLENLTLTQDGKLEEGANDRYFRMSGLRFDLIRLRFATVSPMNFSNHNTYKTSVTSYNGSHIHKRCVLDFMLRTIVLGRVDKEGVSPHTHDRKRERDEEGREREEEGRTWKLGRYKLLTSEASTVGHQTVLSFMRCWVYDLKLFVEHFLFLSLTLSK